MTGFPTRLSVAFLSLAGMAVGHVVTYVVSVPDPSMRSHVLAATGHHLRPLCLAACVALVTVTFAVGSPRVVPPGRRPSAVWAAVAARLSILQIIAFTVLETLERAVSGGGHELVAAEALLLVGLPVQVLVASTCAWLLIKVATAISLATAAHGPFPEPGLSCLPSPTAARGPARLCIGTGGPTWRGPPAYLRP